MLISAISPQTNHANLFVTKHLQTLSSKPNPTTTAPLLSLPNNHALRHVTHSAPSPNPEQELVSSASALASAIRRASSTSPVEFSQRFEPSSKGNLVLPSPDFQRLCMDQLHLFRRVVDSNAFLSVYVRPAGSYVMDRLELRCVTLYPGGGNASSDVVILIADFNVPAGLRAAEAALSNCQVEVIPEWRAAVFPLLKNPFVVGFLVAELPMTIRDVKGQEHRDLMHCPSPEETHSLSASSSRKLWEIQTAENESLSTYNLTAEQRLNAINIARSLAMAYVMDQKAMILQQSSWQNNIRMSNLVEQIRGPLSSIRALSKMLYVHLKRSEISHDIVEDILIQGDRIRDSLQQLQDAVQVTKANIVRCNDETLKTIHETGYGHPESVRSHLQNHSAKESSSSSMQNSSESLSLTSSVKDAEMPMPPLVLAPIKQRNIRPCNVSTVLADLVEAVSPLAVKQQRAIELRELSQSSQVAIEEPALRQALSNLIEGALLRTHVGGKVEIVSTAVPAGGILVVIDDDGPDMHYMTQMRSLAPFGEDLLSKDMIDDNMTWNFVAGLTVAREILESYGCVVCIRSPRIKDAALGAGGTRIELWLPSMPSLPDISSSEQEVA